MATPQYYDVYPGMHEMRGPLPTLPTKPFPSPEFFYRNGSHHVLHSPAQEGGLPLELIVVGAISVEHDQSNQRIIGRVQGDSNRLVEAVCFDPLYAGLENLRLLTEPPRPDNSPATISPNLPASSASQTSAILVEDLSAGVAGEAEGDSTVLKECGKGDDGAAKTEEEDPAVKDLGNEKEEKPAKKASRNAQWYAKIETLPLYEKHRKRMVTSHRFPRISYRITGICPKKENWGRKRCVHIHLLPR
jgi:hypothetical protein